ncbi:hypothetical protein Tco_1131918 [Tanacetum coccineum]|uniref:Reverse transcriptase domain-containing protein n=1 Tax=Tanacetum coccineum TaxID=301880 RepID=A0ABQ5JAG8_9ASTR
MGDEHLSTIPKKKESSVKDLVPIPSESEDISDIMCDVLFCENSHPLDALKYHSEIFFDSNDDYASSGGKDDPLYKKSSGNPTSHSDLSLPDYEAFYYDNEPDSENFTIDVVEDIFDNPTRELYVHVPNVFPTHLSLYLDLDFAPYDDSLGSDLVVSFPSETRNPLFEIQGFSISLNDQI